MMTYRMYVVGKRWNVFKDAEIYQKGYCVITDIHTVYNLWGTFIDSNDNKPHKVVNNVSKEVWDRFDVPVVKMEKRKRDRKDLKEFDTQPVKEKSKINKSEGRKVQNDEIEKWLAENYNIDLELIKEKKDE